ncbi:nuclear protein [Cryptococcus bacillisporus CA1873]|uniref:Nuclear protein n=1 Tax=Cryptococcus bacillisporus CA1873 TaxID=1296111 RepID=A0ABR5B2Q8_CRYGA|nr:nuclear protein [Cryptococcus bacillisporus CA1873]|eukprot:KIR57878.1 nuclear protein [Cryptococcus gattii CA1873]
MTALHPTISSSDIHLDSPHSYSRYGSTLLPNSSASPSPSTAHPPLSGTSAGDMQAEAPELIEEIGEGGSEEGDQIILDSQPEIDVEDLTGEMEYENLRYRTERERKRVKVYELRDESWFDRGTGICRGMINADGHAVILVEAEGAQVQGNEDEPGGFLTKDILLNSNVERDDIYGKQQDTLIVWTDPESKLDIALSFQDADGCEDTWQFICEVQKHLISIEDESQVPSSSSPMGGSPMMVANAHMANAEQKLPWQPPTLANIREQEFCIRAQAKSAMGRERAMEHILNEATEDLESLDDLHALCSLMQTILLFNDNGIFEYILQDDVFLGVIGMLEYDPEFPELKATYRQYFQGNARFREVVPIPDPIIRNKIHQTYRLLFLKDVVLARVLDDSAFNILNGFIFFNQVDIINYIQQSDGFLTQLFEAFRDPLPPPPPSDTPPEPLDDKKRDTVMFLHQLVMMGKSIQLPPRLQLYRTLVDRGLLRVIEWSFRRPEAKILHAGAEMLTLVVEHDASSVRSFVFKEQEQKERTLVKETIELLHKTTNVGLMGQMADTLKTMLEVPPDNESFMAKKEGPLAEQFMTHFYETWAIYLFKPLLDIPDYKAEQPTTKLTREYTSLLQNLVELLSYCVVNHPHKGSYFILSNPISKKVVALLYIRDKPLRHAALRFLKACLRTANHFIHRHFVKNDLLGPLMMLLEEESLRDNMMSSACMEVVEQIRKVNKSSFILDNLKTIINYLFESYAPRLEALSRRPLMRGIMMGIRSRWEMNNEPTPSMPLVAATSATSIGGEDSWVNEEKKEDDYFNASDEDTDTTVVDNMEDGVGEEEEEEGAVPAKRKRLHSGGGPKKRAQRTGSALGLDYDDNSDPESPVSTPQHIEHSSSTPVSTTSTSLLERTVSRAQAVAEKEKNTSELEDDLGDVQAKMREKRRREEEDEEEGGFAGLLVGAKPQPVATIAASAASGGGAIGAGKGEEERDDERDTAVQSEIPTTGEGKKGLKDMGKKIRLNLGLGKKFNK